MHCKSQGALAGTIGLKHRNPPYFTRNHIFRLLWMRSTEFQMSSIIQGCLLHQIRNSEIENEFHLSENIRQTVYDYHWFSSDQSLHNTWNPTLWAAPVEINSCAHQKKCTCRKRVPEWPQKQLVLVIQPVWIVWIKVQTNIDTYAPKTERRDY